MVLIINDWVGKLTNNILQVIRAIHYAITKKHSVVHILPIFNHL